MRHKITHIVVGIMIGIILTATATEGRSLLAHCKAIRKQEKLIKVLDGKDLAKETVWNTLEGKGDLVIEIDYGVVLNSKGDGRILNTSSKRYNYISYRRVKGVHKGDVVMSVFIYAPDRRAYDDDLVRYDWIIDKRR